jgi:hypothetical protein
LVLSLLGDGRTSSSSAVALISAEATWSTGAKIEAFKSRNFAQGSTSFRSSSSGSGGRDRVCDLSGRRAAAVPEDFIRRRRAARQVSPGSSEGASHFGPTKQLEPTKTFGWSSQSRLSRDGTPKSVGFHNQLI